MSEVKWIKITTDIFDDEKIRLLETLPDADAILIIWFKLITMAGKCNDSGVVYLTRDIPYNDEMLSTIMRRPINTIRLALNEFCKLSMISIENNFIALINWEKHQKLDKLEMVKEQTRVRVQNHREKQKEITCNVTERYGNADRLDKIRLDKIRKDIYIKKPRTAFICPSLEEVKQWNIDNNIGLKEYAIEYAFNYYESNGWMVGKLKMKDWKAAFRRVRIWDIKEPKESDEEMIARVIKKHEDKKNAAI